MPTLTALPWRCSRPRGDGGLSGAPAAEEGLSTGTVCGPLGEVCVHLPSLQHIVTMTEYKKEFPFPVVFSPEVPLNCTAEWLAKKQLPQFHCAGEERAHTDSPLTRVP